METPDDGEKARERTERLIKLNGPMVAAGFRLTRGRMDIGPPDPGAEGEQGDEPNPLSEHTQTPSSAPNKGNETMTLGEQKAENRASKAEMRDEVNQRLSEMRNEHNEAIGEIKELKGSIESAFEKQSAERETFRAELRGDMEELRGDMKGLRGEMGEVKTSNEWASLFVKAGFGVIAALIALLGLAFSRGIGLF